MQVEMHTFFVRLDVAGQLPTAIDAALAAATRELIAGNLREAQRYVTTAHTATAKLGDALASLESWGKAIPAVAELPDPAPAQAPEPAPQPQQDNAPTTGQGGESWSQYTEGTVDATSLSDADTAFYVGQAASNAFFWKGIVRGSADEMKGIYDRWNHRGRFALDAPEKEAAYFASNTPLYQAYLAAGNPAFT